MIRRAALLLLGVAVASGCSNPVPLPPYAYPAPTAIATPIATPSSIVGVATWYGNVRKWGEPTVAWYTRKSKWGDPVEYYAAAGPALRDLLGDSNPYHEHYPIRVTNVATGRSIIAVVVDWCSCSSGGKQEKLVDLSPAAFKALGASLGRGILKVEVELLP